jgi:hypothetical protein
MRAEQVPKRMVSPPTRRGECQPGATSNPGTYSRQENTMYTSTVDTEGTMRVTVDEGVVIYSPATSWVFFSRRPNGALVRSKMPRALEARFGKQTAEVAR